MNSKVELLAPAGNKEAFLGAVSAGADAVYLAGNKFGARAYADNFTTEDLIYCIRYGHIHNCKTYLTVNTLLKNEELDSLYDYMKPFYEAGLDGVIIQDMGVVSFLSHNFPGMELHASTQMSITGAYGAEFLKQMGICRIVPARELQLNEITEIKQKTGLELETFVHGAMCYCYSGQCLFSSILGGRSGNRGRCAQPCRLPYKVSLPNGSPDLPQKEYYPLSLKDMCTIEFVPELIKSGIDSFKIEGRMKKPEYAAGVTAIYRKYIDKYYADPNGDYKVSSQDLKDLASLYIRSEKQTGYYSRRNGREMISLNSPSYSGSNDTLLASIKRKYLTDVKRLPVTIYVSMIQNSEIYLQLGYGDRIVSVTGPVAMPAIKSPLTSQDIEKQISKLGDTCFYPQQITIDTDEISFCPVKELNRLRREAVSRLEDLIIEANGLIARRIVPNEREQTSLSQQSYFQDAYTILVNSVDQFKAVNDWLDQHSATSINRIYLESHLYCYQYDKIHNYAARCMSQNIAVYVALPYVYRKDSSKETEFAVKQYQSGMVSGFLVRNQEELGYLLSNQIPEIILDSNMYVWNRESLAFYAQKKLEMTAPVELNGAECRELMRFYPLEKQVYGRLPMMVTANCIAKTMNKCRKGSSDKLAFADITDRKNVTFPVALLCSSCMNIIYNSVPISLHKEADRYRKVNKRMVFTTENAKETEDILNYWLSPGKSEKDIPPYTGYTTGHEKRGVE